jgi:YD repeat-containing protein
MILGTATPLFMSNTGPFSYAASFRSKLEFLFMSLGIALVCCCATGASAACLTGEQEWQAATTNLTRCGLAGYLTNDTYYSIEEKLTVEWKSFAGFGTATQHQYIKKTYPLGPFDFSCLTACSSPSETNYSATYIPWNPGGNFGAIFDGVAICARTTNTSLGNTSFLLEFESTLSPPDCDADWKDRTEHALSGGTYTLGQFATDTLDRATNWVSAGNSGAQTVLYMKDENRKCAYAQLIRYRIRFKTKIGVTYTVKWDLKMDEADDFDNVTNTVLVTGLSQGNLLGNGNDIFTDWVHLPPPAIDHRYNAQAINITVESDEDSCSSGTCGSGDDDTPGDGNDRLRSASFWISLGAGTIDESAGILSFEADAPSVALATPEALQFQINTNVVVLATNVAGSIHVAAPTVLARIVPTNSFAYWVHCSAKSGGSYLTNSPFLSHLILNPDGASSSNRLLHLRFSGGTPITNEFVSEAASAFTNIWSLTSGNGLRGERLSKFTDTNTQTRLESYTRFEPATSAVVFRRDRLYGESPYTELLLSETIDPAGLALLTTNSYDASGRLLLSVQSDGSWYRQEYDSTGWLARVVRPFTNQPPTASTNDCRVTEYSYASVSGSGDSATSQVGHPRIVYELILGAVVSKTMHAYGSQQTYTQLASEPSAGWDDPGNEKSYSIEDSEHRVTETGNPDGTYTTVTYTDNGTGRLTTTKSFGSDAVELRRTEEQVDTLGRMVSRKEYDVPSSPDILMSQELYSALDDFERPTQIEYLDTTTSVTVKQDCCNAAYSIDRHGVTNTYSYDALKRLVSTTRLGITTSNLLDAADRVLAQTRKGTNGSLITLRTLGYDAANRVIRETNALGAVTAYSHIVDGSNQRILFTTNADGGTRIETYFRDGQLASVTGTAAFPVRYEYGRVLDGSYQRAFTKEIKLDASGADTSECVTNFVDAFGHAYKTGFPGTGSPAREMRYNAKGQLTNQIDPDGIRTLFQYNTKGEREYVCIDSNRNDLIDLDRQDRITQTVSDVVANHGTDVLRTRTYVWQTDGSSSSTLVSTSETSVDGLSTWSDTLGAVSTSVKTPPSSGSYTVTQTAPDGSYSISLYQNGRMASITRYDSGSSQVGKTTYGYDEHGRRNTSTDARTGTTTYTFNNADQIVTVTTPPPGTGAPAQTITTYFDAMGRATSIVQADGTTVNNVFSLRGELLRTSGSRTYPVGYSYEAQGRMKTMTNWSTFSSSTGARVTTWHYDAQRGWMTNKVYADSNGTKYSYTAAGRLSTRLWARGTNTTYSYNNFGDLSGVSYNDGATPTVSYTYTRRGQQQNVTRGSDSWKLFYTAAGQLLSETGTAGTVNGLRVTNAFDAYLRRTSVGSANGATTLTAHDYGYDTAGRLSSAADGTFSATYSYLANSRLVSEIEFTSNSIVKLTTTKTYDNLNRLSSISSAPSAASALSYTYSYNDANQRTRVNLADGSFWIYEYDALGQVKSGKRYWSDWTPVAGQQFEYGFDDIGNPGLPEGRVLPC